jgi:hypothetical protein
MSEGKVVADGDAQSVLGDPLVSARANVLPPQLVTFARTQGWIDRFPQDAFEAKTRLEEENEVGKMEKGAG